MDEFRAYLAELRESPGMIPPEHLLRDSRHSEEIPSTPTLEPQDFESSMDAGRYLADVLSELDRVHVDHNGGLWSWLALFYIDQLVPPDAEGNRRPREDERYVMSPQRSAQDFRRYYRHLLATPFMLVRMHGELARVLLEGQVRVHGDMVEQLASRQELITNRAVMEVIDSLYSTTNPAGRDALKRGATDRSRPGNVRRLVDILYQLDLTYDLYGLTGEELLLLLPPEFDEWRETGPPTSRAAVPASPQRLPGTPDPNDPLVAALEGENLEWIQGGSGGPLWVIGGQDLGRRLDGLTQGSTRFVFIPRGAEETGRRPAWYLQRRPSGG